MVWPNHWKSVLVISLALVLLYPAVVRADVPSSYITESITATYNPDGSSQGMERIGYVEVDVPNTQDVLQYLELTLSSTTDTNLQSTIAYKGVAASPNSGDRTRLYMNTTASDSNISYEVSASAARVIYIDMDYTNVAGGQDLFSGGTNYLEFNVTMNSTHDLAGVSAYIRFARNTQVLADSMSAYSVSSTSGSAQRQDSDGDGYYDTVYWTGDLIAGVDVGIDLMGETTPDVNYEENFMSVDLDQGTTSQASYSNPTSTFTGISFSDRFSRGPVREGIEMFTMANWNVRGFIRNMASGLDYDVNDWDIYQVGSSTPLASGSPGTQILPGEVEYSDWYDTGTPGASEKIGYYNIAWDWEVGWGSSAYSSSSTGIIILPVLYEMDAWADSSVTIASNTQSGISLSAQGTGRHMGHANLEVNSATISSVIPRQSSEGGTNTWSPSGVRVLFINGSGQTDITSQASVSTQAAGAGNGFVNVQIPDLGSIVGRLQQNEDIRVEYSLSGGPHATSQTYRFCQTSTLVTASGTPASQNACQDVVIPGTGSPPSPPGGGGGGGGGAIQPALYADIVRKAGEGYFVADNLVDVQGEYDIVDTGTSGVRDVRAALYIPEHGVLDPSSVIFRIYDSSLGQWVEWAQGSDYTVNDNGMTTVGDARYREYLIKKTSSGGVVEEKLDLYDGDRVGIGFRTTVPTGTSFIITRVIGYNYYEDKLMFEDMYIPVRREGILQDLLVDESGWQMERVMVGTPVRWFRGITIENPNNVSVEQSMSLAVFSDTLSARFSGEGRDEPLVLKEGQGTYVDVIVRLGPGESGNFVLEATTPPVLEVGRAVDVLESGEREIIFMVNSTLENFALEEYPGVYMGFGVPEEKIISVIENGNPVNFSGSGESSSEIFLGTMGPGWKRDISIIYREVPPILITAMSSFIYGCGKEAEMKVVVVPSERESSAYLEIEVMGPEPLTQTTNAQLIELKDIWPWSEIEIPVKIDIGSLPDGEYLVRTSFKKDFQTLLSDQVDFSVNCPERTIVSVSWIGFLGGALVVVIYLVIRARRRKRDELGISTLKKKLRDLR